MTNKTEHAATSTETTTVSPSYTLLKEADAPKLSPKKAGSITYQIGKHPSTNALAIRVSSNDSGGYFSKEWIDVTELKSVLKDVDKDKPFKSSLFKELFKGSSSNNPGFCAAVCRTEGLIKAAPDSTFLHLLDRSFEEWLKAVNKLKPIGTADDVNKTEAKQQNGSSESPESSTKPSSTTGKNSSLFDRTSGQG